MNNRPLSLSGYIPPESMTFVLGNILTVKFNQYGQLVIAIISVTLSILVVTGVL